MKFRSRGPEHKPKECDLDRTITLCAECDREYILLDIRTFRKLDKRIQKLLTESKPTVFPINGVKGNA